jgi:hypothetical protein
MSLNRMNLKPDTMRPRHFFLMGICLFWLVPGIRSQNQEVEKETAVKSIWDGSRTTPVHIIPLKDEFDEPVIPTTSYPLPYSTRTSCAPCHDYAAVSRGFHFNAGKEGGDGRAGEPWIWVDKNTGTLLPLSLRPRPDSYHPKDAGLTAWDFTLRFGRHLNGGGAAEPALEKMSPESRWFVSGKLEINCMGCHNAERVQSHSEWAIQVMRENFRWAAAAASGLGEVTGIALRLPPTWDIYDGPNPDDSEYAVVPEVKYHGRYFDSRHRAFLDITGDPRDELCLACHSVTPAGAPRIQTESDVHSRSGLQCVDCHRNGPAHHIIRGYESEARETGEAFRAQFTCRGCHLGEDFPEKSTWETGKLGAPYPAHKGIPQVHFEKLTCTVCHSGPLPASEAARVRTSRANRLGIYGIARWYTQMPAVYEPVYVRNPEGQVEPRRLIWPAYWVRIKGNTMTPLKPEIISASGESILNVEEQAAALLLTLSAGLDIEGTPGLIYQGRLFTPNMDNRVAAEVREWDAPDNTPVYVINQKDKTIPLIPAFDPFAEEPDMEAEARIQEVLTALQTHESAPAAPGIIYKNAFFRLDQGWLEKEEWGGTPAEVPYLVWLTGELPEPVISYFHLRTIHALTGIEQTLTEEQVTMMLHKLAQNEQENNEDIRFGYISGGRLFSLDEGGFLQSEIHSRADPVTWPLAHQVRPVQQSLGIHGCKDCHNVISDFFFTELKGTGPLLTQNTAKKSAASLMGLDGYFQRLFGLSFAVRGLLKIVLIAALFGTGLLLLWIVVHLMKKHAGLLDKGR